MLRRFDFEVTGGSPYNGIIVVVAHQVSTATRLAQAHVDQMTADSLCSTFELKSVRIHPFSTPCVVYSNSGEA